MNADLSVKTEDLVPVRSRISWGAIFAGSVLALSLYFLLALLGAAVGFSIGDKVTAHTLGTAAAVFAIIVTAVCLFIGGYVASQLTTGENKIEGSLYGIFVWAVVFAMLLWLMASGVRVGYNAMIGVATAGHVTAENTSQADWENSARQAGVPQERIDEWKVKAKDAPAAARQAAEDPQNQQAAAAAATRAAWYAFFGAWISMMAAAVGGYLGSGPTLRLISMKLEHVHREGRPVVTRA
ncbi:hypothetical protein [Fimbriiglobus ruber]|uniref:Uncharacterized protein n=1 Tax=Fimbriiglobus ruber TaxID=1908690 RepID=A0A225E4R6_9BACT|nr:hypothetical protein [Fimbriiglobus ruber]OWK46754.1 hypothetical protein FRUB_00453 [Fimbriiglobus ruber]